MNYCLKKDTTIVIDGSENLKEVMLQNAVNSGFKIEEVEILTEEEYTVRIDSLPKELQPLSLEERITLIETMQLQQEGMI